MLNLFLLKLTYGVEIGAELAYNGHYKRTGKVTIKQIAAEEAEHRANLELILHSLQSKPSILINKVFEYIGKFVGLMCMYAPEKYLDIVARLLEIFAVASYRYFSIQYPQHMDIFLDMYRAEKRHELYFTRNKKE